MNNLEEFISSLRKYGHLTGFKLDIETAKKIEEIQLNIINDIKNKLTNLNLDDLNKLISELSQNGLMQTLIKEASKALGEEIDINNADEAFKEALEGNMNFRGAKASLIALQAVSRLYAEKYKEKNGEILNVSPYCPICGSESKTMIKADNDYKMVCHFCGYIWKVSEKKIVCPYCGNSEEFSLGVFSDKEGRVGLVYCQNCKSSWRIILDESIKAPSILLPLIALGGEKFKGALPISDQ